MPGYHMTKKGKKAKKGLWYNINKKKKRTGKKDLGTKKDGTVSDKAMKKSQK